jgi:hypothetical protein
MTGMDPRAHDPHPREGERRRARRAVPPTVRQVYALAAVLCEKQGEEFPGTREAASELIERLRLETGHPAPRLDDAPAGSPLRPRRGPEDV